jgi:PhnB protein
MKSLAAYLNFDGKTEEAFAFYRKAFGVGPPALVRFRDMPDAGRVSDEEKDLIMHINLNLGDNLMLAGSDVPRSMGMKLEVGNNVHLMVETDTEEEARDLYAKLSAGGKIHMELQKTFWGALYANFSDKFGVQWMINFPLPKS